MLPINSFFSQRYDGISVLVIVPHQDDEINAAGALIYTLSRCGAKISLVYSTNGDWKNPAHIRFQEAVSSAAILGVKEENIYFLGYGDAQASPEHNHLFYTVSSPATSTAGFKETYGADSHQDYAYKKTGAHHSYLASNYLEDIVAIIREIKADLIVCTDFDEHPDHRMLSLYFDRAMGLVRKAEPEYRPEVWKRFAYSLGYTAVADYSLINNPETKRPIVGITGKYEREIIGTSVYDWEERIRIPTPYANAEFRENPLIKALNRHKSQFIITRADRILNSDEVYWRRRTDSLSYSAVITVSSGKGDYLNDFMLYDVSELDSPAPLYMNYYWQPERNDCLKRIKLHWDTPQHIEQIVLYGTITCDSNIKKIRIELSDGYDVVHGGIQPHGRPTRISVGAHDNITDCEISLVEVDGTDYGLSEVEVYGSATPDSIIRPFCKILVNDNFAYEYLCDMETKSLSLDLYCYGTESSESIRVVKGNSKIIDRQLVIDNSDSDIHLQAENAEQGIADYVVIKRLSQRQQREFIRKDKSVKRYLARAKWRQKMSNMYYILKNQGCSAVIFRIFKNHILPKKYGTK